MVMLGLWILIQIMSQMAAGSGEGGGGIAYLAHIAGFVAGLVLVRLFASRGPRYAHA
jgi:membrane associated rhomboid family serine protease